MAETKPERINIAAEVACRKQDLLEALRANRENHRKDFELALQGWHDESIAALDKMKDDLGKGRRLDIMIHKPLPEDHTRDYDREIKKLEMCLDDHVIIPTQEFAHYVMDDWAWKQAWKMSNSSYVATAQTRR